MIQQLLRLALFFFFCYFYAFMLKDKLGYHKRLVWIVVYCFYVIVLYAAVLAGLLQLASVGLLVVGLVLAGYYLLKKIKNKRKHLTQLMRIDHLDFLMAFLLVLFGSTLFMTQLVHYDNFSHWALIVKYLLTESSLPAISDGIISFSAYPIGSSLFVYYVSWVAGYSESILLIGQFLLIIAAFYALFAVSRDDRKALVSGLIFSSLAVFNYFNIAIRMNTLLVDFLLPLLALAALSGIYVYRDNFKLASFHTAVILSVLGIVKNSGVFFVLLVLAYYLFIAIKQMKKYGFRLFTIILMIGTVFSTFILDIVWGQHVKSTFVEVTSKHAVSLSSYQEIFSSKSSEIIDQVTATYIKTILSLETVSTQGILLIQIVFIGTMLFIHFGFKRKSKLMPVFIVLDSAIVLYYVGILLMFLFSMPTDEALVLAGFDRYASSMVIFGLGVYALAMAVEMDRLFYEQSLQARTYKSFKSIKHKKAYQTSTMLLFFISIGLLLSENNGMLYTNKQYENTIPYKVKQVTGDNMILNEKRYLIISSDKESVDNYLVSFVGKYFLYSPNVDAIESLMMSDEAFIALLKNYDSIVLIDDHFTFQALTKKQLGVELKPGLYSTADLLKGI
ncbi:MAG: lantibiotic ABC transporter permease [Carnobacterium sp.]|nr:lantibiotic ABC transporter permease [Carnobacterium sp.]